MPASRPFPGTAPDEVTGAVDLVTFGCRLNSYESEVMLDHARAAGLTDAVIINTCAVTAEAEKQARQAIRKIRRERPMARIIVTGCAAEISPDRYRAMPEVSDVLGNRAKLHAESFQALAAFAPPPAVLAETAHHLAERFEGMERAFVQVQNGCDHRCTFCVIPFGRGPSRSVPVGVIADHVARLLARGYREIVFTGVDITAYGADLPGAPTLGQMVRRVLALNPSLPRLRLSSLDPVEIDEDLWHVIAAEPRLMPHLHLSVQAGDDMVLKRMKRRHTREDVLRVSARARALRPGLVLGADLIAGFPTEDEAMFENTRRLVDEAELTWLHVFPYSAREGTPAARMPQLPMDVRKARAARLRAEGEAQVKRHLAALQGTVQEVLVESAKNGACVGRTASYAEVRFSAPLAPGGLTNVFITGMEDGKLAAILHESSKAA